MKKFYTNVAIGPAVGGGFVVLLDGRPIRTPEKALMCAPNEALAGAIAAEWQAQAETIVPDTMPLTQLLTTAIDRVTPQRAAIESAAMAYLDSDLICYHADEPEILRAEQERLWAPWLKWFETQFGTPLQMTYTLNKIDQGRKAHEAVETYIKGLETNRFTAFQAVTNLTGSIVIALAFMEGQINAVEAWRCALCEELFYERTHDLEKHGLDPIEEKRRNTLLHDLEGACAFLKLIG